MALILLRSSLIKLIKGDLLFWNCIQQPGKGTKKTPTSVKSGAFGAVCGKSLSASSSLAFPWGFRDLFWEFWGFCSTRGRTRNIPKSQPSDVSSARFQPQNPGFIPVFYPGLFLVYSDSSRFFPGSSQFIYPGLLSWFIQVFSCFFPGSPRFIYPGLFQVLSGFIPDYFSQFTLPSSTRHRLLTFLFYLSWFYPGLSRFFQMYPGFIVVLSRFIQMYPGLIPVH